MAKKPSVKAKLPTDRHLTETKGLPSASRFDADLRCLGKRALEIQLPPEPDNKNTKRGNVIHEALEKSELSGLSKSDAITASRCMYAEGELIHKHEFEGAHVLWEERIWDSDDDFNPTWSAKLDALHILGKRALFMDYKTGFGITQPIERNWQIGSQAALIRAKHGVEEAIGALIHPHHPDSLYEDVIFSAEKLDSMLVTVRGKVEAIAEPHQPRTPNAISCQYCRAKAICPEFKDKMERLAKDILSESNDEGFTRIVNRTPAERGRHIKSLKMVASAIGVIEEQYKQLLASGDTAIGYTLQKSWNREVTDETKAMELTKKEWGDTAVAHAIKFNLVSLQGYLEKDRSKKKAKEDVDRVLKPVIKFKPKAAALKESATI